MKLLKVILFFFIISPLAWSFRFTPISLSLGPKGSASKGSFLVENPSKAPVAIELSIKGRIQKVDGSEDRPERSKDFLVIPEQVIIPAGERQTIRVHYKGKQDLKHEQSYRIIAEQLPIPSNKKEGKKIKSNIQVLLKYVGNIYITKKDFKPSVKITSISRNEKTDNLKVVMKNNGTKHQILRDLSLRIISKGKPISLKGEKELKGIYGQNVLAGKTRQFFIDIPEHLSSLENLQGNLKFEE